MPFSDPVARKAYHKAYNIKWRETRKEEIRQRMAAYYLANKEHILKKTKTYQKANKPRYAALKRAYRKKFPEYDIEYAKKNVDHLRVKNKRWQENNRDKCNAASRRYRQNNPDKHCAQSARRRASNLKATPRWSETVAIKQIYKTAAQLKLTVDHIVPLRSKFVCGLHVLANLQLLPRRVNSSKGNRHWPDMP